MNYFYLRLVFILLMCEYSMSSFSQSKSLECDTIYSTPDEIPTYTAGQGDLVQDVQRLIPITCIVSGIKITLIIRKDGSVLHSDIIGLDENCRSKVANQLKKLGGW